MPDNLFAICRPRSDVLEGTVRESDFAADLSQVLRGDAPDEYKQPELFFANTYPTKGLKNVLRAGRPAGPGTARAGGVHLSPRHPVRWRQDPRPDRPRPCHARTDRRRERRRIPRSGLAPTAQIRIAAFDGENADPANGRRLTDSIRAFTPWGELAFALAGEAGYRLVETSDQEGIAPGADTLRELIGERAGAHPHRRNRALPAQGLGSKRAAAGAATRGLPDLADEGGRELAQRRAGLHPRGRPRRQGDAMPTAAKRRTSPPSSPKPRAWLRVRPR